MPADDAGLRRPLLRLTEWLAIAGGLVLVFAILVTVTSVVMARFGRPILGDIEIVSLAAGVAIALFLPYCQMQGGNVVITIFTDRLPQRWRAGLDLVMTIAFAVVVVVLTWRLMQGGIDAYGRGRASMFLQLPQSWGFAGATLGMALWVVVTLFTTVEAWRAFGQQRRDGGRPVP